MHAVHVYVHTYSLREVAFTLHAKGGAGGGCRHRKSDKISRRIRCMYQSLPSDPALVDAGYPWPKNILTRFPTIPLQEVPQKEGKKCDEHWKRTHESQAMTIRVSDGAHLAHPTPTVDRAKVPVRQLARTTHSLFSLHSSLNRMKQKAVKESSVQ